MDTMQPEKYDNITPDDENLLLQASKRTSSWPQTEICQSSLCSNSESKNQPYSYPLFNFSTSIPGTQETEIKEGNSDAGFSCDNKYHIFDGPLEKQPKVSPRMEKAVECLKHTFFSNNETQNKSSNARNHLSFSNNEKYPRRNILVDNFFPESKEQINQMTINESEHSCSKYDKTAFIDSWITRASNADFDTRPEDTLTTVSETTSTLENKMTVMLMEPENSKQMKYTKLKSHLLKERVLTCQLITQKTISDLRAKLAEQIVESEQEWKNKISKDIETTQDYLGKMSSMFVTATNNIKKEEEKNETMKKELREEKIKKKYLKAKRRELQKDLDMKSQQIEYKDEKIKELQETIRLNKNIMENDTTELVKQIQLERHTKQKMILLNTKYEDNLKRERQKLEKLKVEMQREKHLHKFTKDAYEALEEDWNIIFKNSLEVHHALVHSTHELNKASSANNYSSFTKH